MVCQSALPTFSSSQHLLYSHLISQTIIWATLLTSCFIFRVNQCPRCVIMKILRPLQDISRMTYCNMQKIWKYKLQNKRVKRWEILLSARTNNKIAKKKKNPHWSIEFYIYVCEYVELVMNLRLHRHGFP